MLEALQIVIDIHVLACEEGFVAAIFAEQPYGIGERNTTLLPVPTAREAAKNAVDWIKADLERGEWSKLLGDKQ